MAYQEHPENARARRDAGKGRNYDNLSPEICQIEAKLALLKQQLRDRVAKEFPVGTQVTVEDLYHGARFIRGPVVKHAGEWHSPYLFVLNEKTGKVRKVSIHNFIYKEQS